MRITCATAPSYLPRSDDDGRASVRWHAQVGPHSKRHRARHALQSSLFASQPNPARVRSGDYVDRSSCTLRASDHEQILELRGIRRKDAPAGVAEETTTTALR